MKVNKLLSLVKALKPTAIAMEDEILLHWVNEIEGIILAEVLLIDPRSVSQISVVDDRELVVKFPYDRLYLQYLVAQIDYANGEYNKYDNSMQLFNAYMGEFQRFVGTYIDPGNGRAEYMGYYIKGDPGKNLELKIDGTTVFWKAEDQEEWQVLQDLEVWIDAVEENVEKNIPKLLPTYLKDFAEELERLAGTDGVSSVAINSADYEAPRMEAVLYERTETEEEKGLILVPSIGVVTQEISTRIGNAIGDVNARISEVETRMDDVIGDINAALAAITIGGVL